MGEVAGAGVEPADAVAAGLETRNANVGDGDGDCVPDAVDKADGAGLGVRLGMGDGIMFSQ